MTDPAPRRILATTWYGAFLLEQGKVRRAFPFPDDPAALLERARARRRGALAPEEEQLLEGIDPREVASRDRRFLARGVALAAGPSAVPPPESLGLSSGRQRELLLQLAAEDLRASWDPSVHVEEAVRGIADLDRALNLLAERLVSWAGRDALASDAVAAEDPERIAEEMAAGTWAGSTELPALDPGLTAGRRALARLYLEGRRARDALETAVAETLPQRAPNLSHLLGAELAARLISQAGGLDRLARLPASTVQVLGAERAFFEHLRGHAPPPRHGLLFLHPRLQSAPRSQRGKLARALAGKAAIAARMDLSGAPLDPALAIAFERRAGDIQASRSSAEGRPRRRSGLPLHRAAEDR